MIRRFFRFLAIAACAFALLAPSLYADTVASRCGVALLRSLARLDPKLVEIHFDHLHASKYFSKPLTPDKSIGSIHKYVVWNPISTRIAKLGLFSPAEKSREEAVDALLSRIEVGVDYNIVVYDDGMALAPVHSNLINNLFSKHLFLANGGSVGFAGVLRRMPDGSWEIRNESGSYKTEEAALSETRDFLVDGLGFSGVRTKAFRPN